VHVEPFLPIPELLDRCALFITHGGFNSIKEAVHAGTPMLIIPIASDQHYSADRAEALGIARVVRPHERTAARIREQVLRVLADPSYRRHTLALSAEMDQLPSMKPRHPTTHPASSTPPDLEAPILLRRQTGHPRNSAASR
jgi:UDP:flavonoid glycosyltransferase YjiC (YdhE family)